MKRCPQCNRVETDDALVFCRADGTELVSDSSSFHSEAGIARLGPASAASEIETSLLPHATSAEVNRSTVPTTLLPTQIPVTTGQLSKSRRRGLVLAMVGLVLIVIAVAGYFYFSIKINAAIQSIAVMPFVNASGNPDAEYLSDGMTETLINSLSQLPKLSVKARSSVFRYKGKEVDPQTVGKELDVQAILNGRIVQRGDDLTLYLSLVDTRSGNQLWGEQYNRKLADVFAVQEEIAQEISGKLRLKLSGSERQHLAKRPTENLKAFQYYIEGRTYVGRRTRKDLLTGVQYFERAIEEDPNYALAYVGLADAYDNLGARSYIAPMEGRRKAEENARKALALDENLAEAHAMTGQVFTDFPPYDFALADRELHRAIELSPSLALAHQHLGGSLVRQGRLDEGLEEYLKALELDPLSPIIARQQALPYYLKRDYARALQLLRRANQLGPAFSVSWEIGPYIQSKSFDEVVIELENAKRERKDDPLLIHFLGMVYAAQRKHAEALGIIKELEGMSGADLSQAHFIAKIYATMNEKELALSWLERGLAVRAIAVFYKDEPVWDPIRNDPRFADLLQRMGIP